MFSLARTTALLLALLVLVAQAIDNPSVASNYTDITLDTRLPNNLTCSLQEPTDYSHKSELEPAIYDFCHRFDQRPVITQGNLVSHKTNVSIGFDHLTLMITNHWCDMVQLDYPSCLGVFIHNIVPSCSLKGGILASKCGFWVIAPDFLVAAPVSSSDMALAKVSDLARREVTEPDTSASRHEQESSLDTPEGVIQRRDFQVDNVTANHLACQVDPASCLYNCSLTGVDATNLPQLNGWANGFCSNISDKPILPGSKTSHVLSDESDDSLAVQFWITNEDESEDVTYTPAECAPTMNSLLEFCFIDTPLTGARGGEYNSGSGAIFGFLVYPADTDMSSSSAMDGTLTSSTVSSITVSSTSLASFSSQSWSFAPLMSSSIASESTISESSTTESIASTSSTSFSISIASSLTASVATASRTTASEATSTSTAASSSATSPPRMNTVDSASASHLMSLASQVSKLV